MPQEKVAHMKKAPPASLQPGLLHDWGSLRRPL
jgi:hypothetical protein